MNSSVSVLSHYETDNFNYIFKMVDVVLFPEFDVKQYPFLYNKKRKDFRDVLKKIMHGNSPIAISGWLTYGILLITNYFIFQLVSLELIFPTCFAKF